jgi:Zn-dependent M16 (insulinase) family peptidase
VLTCHYSLNSQALFPDNSYSHDSGGDPEVIPQLTFEQFQDFHARFYHPSNGRFWFYGDDDATKRLQILDAYLRCVALLLFICVHACMCTST